MRCFLLFIFMSASFTSYAQNNAPIVRNDTTRNFVKAFIPTGYAVLDQATGDLNRDAYPDRVLILRSELDTVIDDAPRPLLLLAGTATGAYKLMARNDKAVLCKGCGGVFGDPYEGISIKNGYFSIEHYAGSNWRWTRIITFKYDAASKQFRLHRDGGVYYHVADPEKMKDVLNNKKDYGKMRFEAFDHEKL